MSDLLNGLRKALDTIPAPLTWVEEDCEDSSRDVRCDNFNEVQKAIDKAKELFSVFLKDYEKLLKDLAEYNLLCELQASMISGLRAFKKQCNGKVIVTRKQLSDEYASLSKEIGAYIFDSLPKEFEYWKHHMLGRYGLLKELLEASETRDSCECPGCHQDLSSCICGEAQK
jgi:hypothetical protein